MEMLQQPLHCKANRKAPGSDPVINGYAFVQPSRFSQERRDPNRFFPGSEKKVR
jgi:hypothetical protein